MNCNLKGGMSVVRVQAYALDVASDVTIIRYSFFEIPVFQSCRELVMITLQFPHQDFNFQSLQLTIE